MKKLAVIVAVTCATLLGAMGFGFSTARADVELSDVYPENFNRELVFEDIKDFAVNGDEYCILDGEKLIRYVGESIEVVPTDGKDVQAVRFGEEFVYKSGEKYYALDGSEIDYEDEVKTDRIDCNGLFYSFHPTEHMITCSDADEVYKFDGSLTLMRLYGDKLYAASSTELFELVGKESRKITLEYLDYAQTSKISSAGLEDSLLSTNAQAPVFVSLTAGAFITQIDLNGGSETFKAGETYKIGETLTAESALLLGKAGKDGSVSVVMICGENDYGNCYILSSDNAQIIDRQALTEKSLTVTVTVTDGYIYSAPFTGGARLIEIKPGDKLNVIAEVTKQTNNELVRDFYKVEITDGENVTTTGYVPTGYVSPFIFDENEPITTPDPDYTEQNDIRTVVLVLLVVILVLCALGYTVYTLTSKKKKDKTK